jgi:hypothetical protein
MLNPSEIRRAALLEMMPEDGYLPGAPAGCSAFVRYYADAGECRITFRYPGPDGAPVEKAVNLADLPLLYLKVLAEQPQPA